MSAFSDRLRHMLTERGSSPAIEGADGSLSYAELDARSAGLAARLVGAGVGRGDFVPVLIDRSVEFVIAVAAVVRCGAAYVPIDDASPDRRRSVWLGSFEWSVALVVGNRPSIVGEAVCLDVAAPSAEPAFEGHHEGGAGRGVWIERGDEAPLYLMFTSGSTGAPKGVVVPDRGVSRLVIEPGFVDLSVADRWALASSVAFDASTLELWAPLLNGGTCVVQEKPLPSLAELGRFFVDARITHAWLTAGLFNLLVADDPGCLAGLGELLVGGERESADHVRRFLESCPGVRLIHGYGPTENTTFSLCHRVESVAHERVPIGRAINGTTAMLIDSDGREVFGAGEGELLVGGAGLALGYLDSPELTGARFIQRDGCRWYRTGDFVQRDAGGVYTFLGRADRQVKLQGNRIELDEVERVLASLPGVGEAVVEVEGEAAEDRRLVGWYTGAGGSVPTPDEVLGMLLERLPRVMTPSRLHSVRSLPRMTSGKIDRRGMGDMAERVVGGAGAGRAKAGLTSTERTIAVIWHEILGCERPGADSRFIESGGTSLLALRVASEIEHELGRRVSPIDVLEHSVLADFASLVERSPRVSVGDVRAIEVSETDITPTCMQRQMLVGSAVDRSGSAYHVHLAMAFPDGVRREAIHGACERLLERHAALRVCATVWGDRVRLHPAARPGDDWWVEHEAVTLAGAGLAVPTSVLGVLGRPFDLNGGGLARVDVWPALGGGWLVVLTAHHAVMDDYSLRLCLEELVEDLDSARPPERVAIAPVDLAEFERRGLDRGEADRCADRVAAALGGQSPPMVPGPTLGGEVSVELDLDTQRRVNALARQHGCTPFPVLLAAYGSAVQRVFGPGWRFVLTPFSRRGSSELVDTVGCVLDLRLIEAGARPGESPTETVGRVCGEVSGCMRPTFLPFEDLVNAVGRRDPALADAPGQFVFTWRTEVPEEFAIAGAKGRVLRVPQQGARFGMAMHVTRGDRGLDAHIEAGDAVLGDGLAAEVIATLAKVLDEWAAEGEGAGRHAIVEGGEPSSGGASAACDRGGVVAAAWSEVLGAAPSDDQSDFLRAGGSSILSLKLAALLHRRCGVEIDLGAFMTDPRFGELCRAVWCARLREVRSCGVVGTGAEERVVLIIPGAMGRSVGMVGLANALRSRSGGSRAYVIADLEEILGGVSGAPRGQHFVDELLATVEQIGVDRLAGIVGYSIGGLLGLDVAARLGDERGVDIPVCLLDSYIPTMLRRDLRSRVSRRVIRLARLLLRGRVRSSRRAKMLAEPRQAEVLEVRERVERDPGWRVLFEDMARRPVPAGAGCLLIRSESTADAVGVFGFRLSNGFDPGTFKELRVGNVSIDHLDLVKGGAAEVVAVMADLGWLEGSQR